MQQHVAQLQGYNGILQSIPAVIYALFVGPWSDANGRKFLILWSIFGSVLMNAVFILNVHFFPDLPAQFLLFEVSICNTVHRLPECWLQSSPLKKFSQPGSSYLAGPCTTCFPPQALQNCTGGQVCFFLGIYSYICDITTEAERSRRLAVVDAFYPMAVSVARCVAKMIHNFSS